MGPWRSCARSPLRQAHTLRVRLELPEDLLPQGMGDLRIDAGILNILVAQVVGHIRNPAAGFQEVHGHGMAQGMHRARLEAGRLGVLGEELLHLALLQGPLAAGEQIGPDISPLPQIAAQQCGPVPPQRLFAAKAVLQAPDGDPMIVKVHIVDGAHQGFADAQAVVVDETKERAIPGGINHREEALQFVFGAIFG
jgi:hypothetical protein